MQSVLPQNITNTKNRQKLICMSLLLNRLHSNKWLFTLNVHSVLFQDLKLVVSFTLIFALLTFLAWLLLFFVVFHVYVTALVHKSLLLCKSSTYVN